MQLTQNRQHCVGFTYLRFATHRPGLHVSLIEDSNAALLAELQRGSGESGASQALLVEVDAEDLRHAAF